jgi:hypothetical protein
MPLDVATLAMSEGAAQRGRYNHCEAGAEGGVYQYFFRKPGGLEHPKEKRHEDDPAANAEQARKKACQASKDDK